jgi:cytochrome c oxidase assembly protein subunit 11
MSQSTHGKLVLRLGLVAVAMFAFGVFAMPPLYQKFCEFTGLGQAGVTIEEAAPGASTSRRTVKVRFDATTNSSLKWTFKPLQPSMDVTLGEASSAQYYAANHASTAVAGRAVFNVSPPEAARYFVKTECFCFTRQELEAGQGREMPVYFYVEEALPESITEMTLSYTFFKIEDEPAVAQAAAGSEAESD